MNELTPFEQLRPFGLDMFEGPGEFSPPNDIASSPDYLLGPGDNLIIALWGQVEKEFTLTVDREGKIFIPPIGSAQRKVPDVLGTHKLEIGNGYLIHGTNEETSVGAAVSHGCVRMYNEDVARLFAAVPIGTPVYIR